MNLQELADKVIVGMEAIKKAGVHPKDVEVVLDEGDTEIADASTIEWHEIVDAVAEEFPDDEETYREHVRKGGAREFSFHVKTKHWGK